MDTFCIQSRLMAEIQMYLCKCSTFKTMGLLGDVVGLILSAVCRTVAYPMIGRAR